MFFPFSELIVIQSVLLSGLVLFSVIWAFFCKKRCVGVSTQRKSRSYFHATFVDLNLQDQPLATELSRNMAALARKLSSNSTRTLPPSYSKVDLTSVGLTLTDHLNPPPSYDRIIAMLESGEITSVPVHLHPEIERRMSLASTNSSRRSSRGSRSSSSSRKSSRKTSTSTDASADASVENSRKGSRVTFAPNLIYSNDGNYDRKASSQSLPLQSVLCHPDRKRSTKSETSGAESRKVSFIDELTGMSARPDPEFEQQLTKQLEMVKEAGEMGEFVQKPDEVREDRKLD